jgi:hypothetical protein
MVKVPATPAGIPAIRRLIGRGLNINITLLFSVPVYEQVVDAYNVLKRELFASQSCRVRLRSISPRCCVPPPCGARVSVSASPRWWSKANLPSLPHATSALKLHTV